MTMPAEDVQLICPNCGNQYNDWVRSSINLELADFDDDYIATCSSSVCPYCDHKLNHHVMIVEKGGWHSL